MKVRHQAGKQADNRQVRQVSADRRRGRGDERIYMQDRELRNATEECQSCHGDERWSPTFQTPALEPSFYKSGLLPKISVQSILAPTT